MKSLETNELFGIGTNGELKNISFGLYAAEEIVSVPLAVWLGARVVGVTLGAVLRCFLLPWITAGPLALAGWLAWQYLPGSQPFVSAIALALSAPLCLFLSIMAVRVNRA